MSLRTFGDWWLCRSSGKMHAMADPEWMQKPAAEAKPYVPESPEFFFRLFPSMPEAGSVVFVPRFPEHRSNPPIEAYIIGNGAADPYSRGDALAVLGRAAESIPGSKVVVVDRGFRELKRFLECHGARAKDIYCIDEPPSIEEFSSLGANGQARRLKKLWRSANCYFPMLGTAIRDEEFCYQNLRGLEAAADHYRKLVGFLEAVSAGGSGEARETALRYLSSAGKLPS